MELSNLWHKNGQTRTNTKKGLSSLADASKMMKKTKELTLAGSNYSKRTISLDRRKKQCNSTKVYFAQTNSFNSTRVCVQKLEVSSRCAFYFNLVGTRKVKALSKSIVKLIKKKLTNGSKRNLLWRLPMKWGTIRTMKKCQLISYGSFVNFNCSETIK